jgi:hypothetical protein
LKLAENYFGSKNDPSDYYIQKPFEHNGNPEILYMEVNQILINDPNSFDPIIQSVRDPQGEMFAQSSIEHNIKVE